MHAAIRLQYASASVWTLRTRPAEAAAIASSSSLIPSSRRPALTSARPSRLTREHLEVAGVGLPRDLQRTARVLRALLDGLGVSCPLDRDPALPGAEARPVHGALGAREPAAGRGRPSGDEVLVRDPDGRAGCVVAAPDAGVPLDGPLARGDPSGRVAEEPERQTQPVERLGRLLVAEDGLECLPGGVPPRLVERALPVVGPPVSRVAAHGAIVRAERRRLGLDHVPRQPLAELVRVPEHDDQASA